MSNKDLWNSVCRTDPNAVKPITGKQYKGNSPKPYWLIEKATEKFGPCGSGWGVVINNEYFERLTDTDVLHVANVTVWYMLNDKRCELQQMGQTKAVYKTSTGTMLVDEDAPKKSVTDAMVKCLSMIGFAGDIFSGRWDDSKYVSEVAAEYAKEKQNSAVPVKNGSAMDTCKMAFESLLPHRQTEMRGMADELQSIFASKGINDAYDLKESYGLDNDDTTAIWWLLDSKLRTALNKRKKELQQLTQGN